MKSNMPKQTTPAIEEAILNQKMAEIRKTQRDNTLRDFRMGANAVAKLALNQFEEPIKKADTFEELQKLSFDLLEQLNHAVLPQQEQQESEIVSNEQSDT